MIAVGVLVAVASALLWNWAKLRWMVPVSLVAGGIMAFWVLMGAWQPAETLSPAGRFLSWIGSMWIPALLLLLATTAATLRGQPENRIARFLKQ